VALKSTVSKHRRNYTAQAGQTQTGQITAQVPICGLFDADELAGTLKCGGATCYRLDFGLGIQWQPIDHMMDCDRSSEAKEF